MVAFPPSKSCSCLQQWFCFEIGHRQCLRASSESIPPYKRIIVEPGAWDSIADDTLCGWVCLRSY